MFGDYYGSSTPSYTDLENAGPTSVTAAEIEAEKLILVSRYKCDPFEITYEFEKLPSEARNTSEEEYSLLNLKFVMQKYVDGILTKRVVSERVVLVPEHITMQAKMIVGGHRT